MDVAGLLSHAAKPIGVRGQDLTKTSTEKVLD